MIGVSIEAESWTVSQIPPQAGRLAVVTGAASGLGYATALALAKAGADVVLAGADELDGLRAVSQIRPLAPAALVRFERLDPGSLASIAAFASRVCGAGHPIDLLINHSSAPAPADRQLTADGIELQLGANFLAHFALTAHLLPLLRRSRKPRVVHVSSLSHRFGAINFNDLQLERAYDPWRAHCQSMLATLMFAQELQRRSDDQKWGLGSVAAHPGNVRPRLIANGFGPRGLVRRLKSSLGILLSHSAAEGALPALYAATAPNIRRGGFYGPSGPFELVGPPDLAKLSRKAPGPENAIRLWELAEKLTGVKWQSA